MGILGKVEAGAGVAVAVVAVGGAYYVYKKLPEWAPNGIGGALADWFSKLWGGFGGGGGTVPHMAFSKDSAYQGERIAIAVDALQPSTPLLYGWKELNFTQTHTSQSNGQWFFETDIEFTTPPGTYHIFVDQRATGGPYYEKAFTVLAGTNPDPGPVEVNVLNLSSPGVVKPLSGTFTFDVQLYDASTPAPVAGFKIGLFWDGNQIAQGVTDINGHYRRQLPASFFGRGAFTIYASVIPFTADTLPSLQDHLDIAVT